MRVPLTSRGVSLGGTLLAVSVLSMLAFTLASLCVTHLRLSRQQDRGILASNAARSAISAAIAKVLKENDFGEKALADQVIQVNLGGAEGFLTFHPETAKSRNMPYSTNNLTGTEDALSSDGALVPSGTVHLFALGKSDDTVRRIEAVLRVPPFPWAIASGGRIETKNGVVVGSLPEGASLPVALEDLRPADLLANGTQSNAIFLGSQSTILGDVETPGQVVLGPSPVDIRGEIRNGSSPVKLPELHPASYDPQTTGLSHFDLNSGQDVDQLTGSARASGNLTFPQPLTLENAQLYVDGNLTLQAGVRGTGILVATGDITIRGGAQIEGATELAVVAGGRVRLSGSGQNTSVIRGLFYAELGLEAAELTLVGSLLTGQASTGVDLDRVNVFYEEPPTIAVKDIRSGTFAVGSKTEQGNDGALNHTFEFEEWDETNPNMTQPWFLFILKPTNGDFPVEVAMGSGRVTLSLQPRVLKGLEDVARYREDLVIALEELDWGHGAAVPHFLIPSFLAQFDEAFTPSKASPAISLFGEISQFLPIEDRIRVVSWVER